MARRMPEETAATKSSEDATQVKAPDHEDEVHATTPTTASRIILRMAATKVTVKERHSTASVVWRNMTTWNEEHETDKCWGEVKNILMGELVIGVPTTFVSENHGYVPVHRGIDFPSSGSVATSIECVRTAHVDTKITPRIKPMWFEGEMTGKRNSCRGMRWSLQESEWKSNSKHVDDITRLWRLKLGSKETPTPVTKATGRRRDIDEALMQHDVRASREAAGTSSTAMGPSIQKETWLYRHQADMETLHARQNTPRAAEDLTKETVLSTVGEHGRRACCDARPSRIRLTNGKSESHGIVRRLPEMASSWRVRVAPSGSEQWRERVAPPELMGVDIEANLPDLEADRNGSKSEGDLWQQCNM